jgi:imidazoleglycerol-phosphate dehydratase
MGRSAKLERTTGETSTSVTLDLDGSGSTDVTTGVPFFDHMLDALGRHALLDLTVKATGDLDVDAHHTVEDTGILFGKAIAAAVDVSGRGSLTYEVEVPIEIIGTFDTTLSKEFFTALASNAGITVHLHEVAGESAHHIVEAAFKAFARALREAVELDPRVSGVPSTKGVL